MFWVFLSLIQGTERLILGSLKSRYMAKWWWCMNFEGFKKKHTEIPAGSHTTSRCQLKMCLCVHQDAGTCYLLILLCACKHLTCKWKNSFFDGACMDQLYIFPVHMWPFSSSKHVVLCIYESCVMHTKTFLLHISICLEKRSSLNVSIHQFFLLHILKAKLNLPL